MRTYYQPIITRGEEDNQWYDVPEGLFDFQAFATREDADLWLVNNFYDPKQWDIHEYHDDDIEDVVVIDAYGNPMGLISERIYGRICNYLAKYDSDDSYSASDLLEEGHRILEQVKEYWDELRSDK